MAQRQLTFLEIMSQYKLILFLHLYFSTLCFLALRAVTFPHSTVTENTSLTLTAIHQHPFKCESEGDLCLL